ncbi:MAG: hypothetical protein ACI8W7_001807 [Gammaproteobacteria bacterium]
MIRSTASIEAITLAIAMASVMASAMASVMTIAINATMKGQRL